MAGDVVRRLVSGTIAQQLSAAVEIATPLHQYMLWSLTKLHPEATVTSIDGISAHNLISKEACSHVLRKEGRRSHLCASSIPWSVCGRMSLAQPTEFRNVQSWHEALHATHE